MAKGKKGRKGRSGKPAEDHSDSRGPATLEEGIREDGEEKQHYDDVLQSFREYHCWFLLEMNRRQAHYDKLSPALQSLL